MQQELAALDAMWDAVKAPKAFASQAKVRHAFPTAFRQVLAL